MSKIISGDTTTVYERWSQPEVSRDARAAQQAERDRSYVRADQIEKIQKQAYEEAYAHGHQEGIAAGQAQVKAQAQRFAQLTAKLTALLGEQDAVVEREMSAFVMMIARLVLQRELSLGADYVARVIKESLAVLPLSCRNIKVSLNPEDAELLRRHAAPPVSEVDYRIVEDASLARGDCRVISDTSRIDATLEGKLAAIEQALFGGGS